MPKQDDLIAYIGVGSNLGNRQSFLRRAIVALDAAPGCRVCRVSPWYESTAVGPGVQADYINAVIELGCTVSASDLLELLQRIEQQNNRRRMELWGPRTLDLDLLVYADLRVESESLRLPHPRLQQRNFVVYPLSDLVPALIMPDGTSVGELRTRLGSSGLRRLEPDREATGA